MVSFTFVFHLNITDYTKEGVMLNIIKSPNNMTSIDFNYPLLKKIQKHLDTEEQDLFIQSFYGYLHCDQSKDYIIDLDNVWEWLGYGQKVKAKTLLENHFIENVDYKVQKLSQQGKQRGGHNKKQILLNVKCLKKLCLKSDTAKADKIHDYYVKMEEILMEHTNELLQTQSYQLKEQQELIQAKDQELLKYKEKTYEEIEKSGHIYVIKTDGGTKVGKTKDIVSKRIKCLQTGNVNNIEVLLDSHTSNSDLLEKCVHYILDRYRCNSNREFFDCNVDYIKMVVETCCKCIDTLKSSYQHITKEEINTKLQSTNVNVYDTKIYDETFDKETEMFHSWLEKHIVYKPESVLKLHSICDSFIGENKIHSSVATKYREQVEEHIKRNFTNLKWEYGVVRVDKHSFNGWKHLEIV